MIRVMVVDDHQGMRDMLGKLLATAIDIDVVAVCQDGQGAIDAVADARPEVILMDLVMPGVTGVEATRQITDRYPHIRVWVHTASTHHQLAEQALAAGAVGVLPKSGDPRTLLAAIRSRPDAPS